MANNFKNGYVALTTSNADIIGAVASGTETICLTLRVTNIHASDDATVDVQVVDTGGSPRLYSKRNVSACWNIC